MTDVLVQSGGGAALAMSFALLGLRRSGSMLTMLGVQSAVVALLAAGQGAWPLACVELVWGAIGLPWLLASRREAVRWSTEGGVMLLAAGAGLAAVCLPLGRIGPGLAIVLLSVLIVAARPGRDTPVVGLASLQNGAALAGLACGGGVALLAAPALSALVAAVASWPESAEAALPARSVRAGRSHAASRRGEQGEQAEQVIGGRLSPAITRGQVAEFGACTVLLVFSCALPWFGSVAGPWRIDPLGVLAAILVSLVATALRWPAGRAVPAHLGGGVMTAGAILAVLAGSLPLLWIGLAIAAVGAMAGAPLRRMRMAALGLGFTLFGSLTLPAAPLPAMAAFLVGLACLGFVAPELAALAVLLALRLRGIVGSMAGLDPLLIAAGLLALLLAVTGLATTSRKQSLPTLGMLGQAGVAMFALGLDTPEANLAAVLQIVLLILTRLAMDLAPEGGLPRLAARAGLAGLPPFGLFPSLALLLAATAERFAVLLVPLLAGLGAFGWLVLRDLPPGVLRFRPALAWLPLAALLLIGFILPGPVGAGLRLVAGELR